MHFLATAFVFHGLALTVAAAGISTRDVVVIPTSVIGASTDVATPTEPNPNMAPIVSDTPLPNIPPPGTCGQAVWVPFLGGVWIQANGACHRFGDAGDIPAPKVEFLNGGYVNCKSCIFWKGPNCVGDLSWMGAVPSEPFSITFDHGTEPYSYFCLGN